MNRDNDESLPTSHDESTDTTTTASGVCEVCGCPEAQNAYGAVCCFPCKMFFRRNEQFDLNTNQCRFNGQCEVNMTSRGACRVCRLKKCFAVGMNREFFRPSHGHNVPHHPQIEEEQQSTIENQPTIDIPDSDRSLLTVDQISLLSNVIHCYDAHSPISDIRKTMAVYENSPPKFRLKNVANHMMSVIGSFYSSAFLFIEAIPQFSSLSVNDRRTLIRRNAHHLGAFNGSHICHEVKLLDNPTNKSIALGEYGPEIMDNVIKIADRTISDGISTKIFLLILSFSTCSDIVQSENFDSSPDNLLSSPMHLLTIQNMFVEIMFNDMMHRFGYEQASKQFTSLIKNALDFGACSQQAQTYRNHEDLVQTIVREAEERILSLANDETMDIAS